MDYICKNKDFNHKNGTCDECKLAPHKKEERKPDKFFEYRDSKINPKHPANTPSINKKEEMHNHYPVLGGKFVLAWDIRCKECSEGIKCNQPYREMTYKELPIVANPPSKKEDMRLLGQELDIAKVFGKETISVQEVKKLRKILGKDLIIRTETQKAYWQGIKVMEKECDRALEKARKEGFEEGREIGNDDFNSLKEDIKQTQLKEIRERVRGMKRPNRPKRNKLIDDLLKELEK